MKSWFRARSVYFGVPRKWGHLMSEEMITTDIDMIRRPSRYPIVGSSPTDFGEASTMFGLIKLNLLISTTNNPPRRKDLGESPRIHQAFHRKFTVQQGKPGPGPHVHSTARSGAVSCRGIGSWGDASDVTGVRMGFNTRVVIHDLDELGYPI
jgi:hypothetical protein